MRCGHVYLGDDGAIAGDLPCLDCGYNLRGLTPLRSCPECGRSIADSIRGGRLPFADPAWIDHLASGCGWLAAGMLLCILQCRISGAEPVTFALFELLPRVLILHGVWRLTTPDRSSLAPSPYQQARQWVRPAVTAWAMAWLLSAGSNLMDGQPVIWAQSIASVGEGLAVLATCRLGHQLAKRMDEPSLAQATLRVGWVWFGLSMVGAVSGLVLGTLMATTTTGAGAPLPSGGAGTTITIGGQTYSAPDWAGPIALIAVLLIAIFGLWLLVLPFQFRNRLRRRVPHLCE